MSKLTNPDLVIDYIWPDKNRKMKLYLFIISSVVLFITGCSNDNNDPKNTGGNNAQLSETALPKGRFIVDDDYTAVITPVDQGGLLNGKDTGSTTTVVADNPHKKELDLKRRYKNLLVFHADDTMKIKKTYIATLVLGKDQLFGDMKEEATENSASANPVTHQDTTIEIGTRMKAKLIDRSGATEKGFDIELIGEDAAEQNLSGNRKKVMWQWKLTPLTEGEQHLTLSITITEKDGSKVNLPVKSIPVVIFAESNFWGSVKSVLKDDSTKWILSAILIPIFIAWFGARMRHKFDTRSQRERDREEKERADAAKQNSIAETPAPVQNTTGSA